MIHCTRAVHCRERWLTERFVDARLTAAHGVSASCPRADPERPLLPADHRTPLTVARSVQLLSVELPSTLDT
jgi:hypothetical protein